MNQLEIKINEILGQWNPIEVPTELAISEYTNYVSRVVNCLEKRENLSECLINILVADIGLNYDESNLIQKEEIAFVCSKISNVYNDFQ